MPGIPGNFERMELNPGFHPVKLRPHSYITIKNGRRKELQRSLPMFVDALPFNDRPQFPILRRAFARLRYIRHA